MPNVRSLAATLVLLCSAPLSAFAQCIPSAPCADTPINLGTLDGATYGYGISGDGSTVVGEIGPNPRAFRWTQSGGMQNIQNNSLFSYSMAYGTNTDGAVIVGKAYNPSSNYHAFRWTQASGMQDIHNSALGSNSYAYGTSADGAVIVGYVESPTWINKAFRWTEAGGMQSIHDSTTFGNDFSYAFGVSADGTVIVGYGSANGYPHAFRWTEAGGMQDIHDSTVFSSSSYARAVSANGTVIVGDGVAGSISHAFRWTQSGGMQDIHNSALFSNSEARGVSADGSVVVGRGDIGSINHAFRWTSATQMQDLNTLLANAGVNMSGITLKNAAGVSADGRFIAGTGMFSSDERAFLVRYDDGAAGLITADGARASVNDLAASRGQTMAQQHGLVARMLGYDRPIQPGSEAGVFAAAGSAIGGTHARFSSHGLTLLGGIAYADESYARSELKSSVSIAAALQYVHEGTSTWKPFAEAGGWITPNASLSYDRIYANGAGSATGSGRTHGDLSYYYGRLGWLFARSDRSQFALSAELGREELKLDGYSEASTPQNPFPAVMSSGNDRMNIAKLRAQVSHQFNDRFDGTVFAAWAHGFERRTSLVANVLLAGPVTPDVSGDLDWFEYGVRIGYRLNEVATLDVFGNGVTGGSDVGSKLHGGLGLRMQF